MDPNPAPRRSRRPLRLLQLLLLFSLALAIVSCDEDDDGSLIPDLIPPAPTSGLTPPATPPASITVRVIIVFGAKAMDSVELNELAMSAGITPAGRSDSDPLQQRRKVGTKYMLKDGVRSSDNLRVIELCSNY